MISLSEAIGQSPCTIGSLLDWPSRFYPSRCALYGHVQLTYKELLERSVARYNVLRNLGVTRFQRWGLLADNSVEFFISFFALARAGAVIAPLDQYQLKEVKETTRFSGFIAPSEFVLPTDTISASLQICESEDNIRIFAPVSPLSPRSLHEPHAVIDVDPALLVRTSGSTRVARGVVLQHRAVLANIRSNVRALGLRDVDRTLVVLPAAHAYALIHQCLCHLAIGATLYLPKTPILAQTLCRNLEEFEISTLTTVPPLLSVLVEGLLRTQRKCSQLRLLTVGASSAQLELLTQAMGLLPDTRFAITYGLTEAGPRVTTSFVERGNVDPACVGVPLPNVELRLQTLANGTSEICVRGSSLMRSYEHETWEEGSDYSLRTSDIGEITDGRLYLRGRLDRAINKGGTIVLAEVVEEVLCRYPSIERARVVPRPHSFWGEVPVAILVLKKSSSGIPSREELRRFCASWLSQAQIPEAFEIDNGEIAPTLKDQRMLSLLDAQPRQT